MCEGLNSEYGSCEEIWQGRFDVTYRCSSVISSDASTCKAIDKRLLTDAIDREYIDKEPKILHLLSGHPSILHINKVFLGENFLNVVTDLCNFADLYDRLTTSARAFSEVDAFRFLTNIFQSTTPKTKEILRKMICKDVFRRLSAERVLRHPWIINKGRNRN
ncbi:calcium,calmodulin-dependent protein kinase, partial [Sarracenia purpurea var. burkii]